MKRLILIFLIVFSCCGKPDPKTHAGEAYQIIISKTLVIEKNDVCIICHESIVEGCVIGDGPVFSEIDCDKAKDFGFNVVKVR